MPGFKTFAVGEEATAADVNGYLMGQTVARFANAAARSTAITAPQLNQLTVCNDRPGAVQYWNGSAWADVVPPPYVPPLPPLPTNMRIEWGSAVATTDIYGGISIALTTPFSGTPVFVAMDGDDVPTGGIGFNCTASSASASHLGVRCTKLDGAWIQNGTVRVNYLAVGPR